MLQGADGPFLQSNTDLRLANLVTELAELKHQFEEVMQAAHVQATAAATDQALIARKPMKGYRSMSPLVYTIQLDLYAARSLYSVPCTWELHGISNPYLALKRGTRLVHIWVDVFSHAQIIFCAARCISCDNPVADLSGLPRIPLPSTLMKSAGPFRGVNICKERSAVEKHGNRASSTTRLPDSCHKKVRQDH
jgi:hypothetical protein